MSLHQLQRDFGAFLRDGDADEAAAGLRVYQNNYRAQLVACLEDGFARTRAWIGETAFEAAAIHHIRTIAPSSWTLDAYGHDFPATLAARYPDDPEVGELAALELALADAFVGPDALCLTMAEAATLDWDRVRLRFVPFDLLPLTSNADAIWTALAGEETPSPATLLEATHALLVWRQDLMSRFRRLDGDERQALLHARAGMSFADLCAAIVAVRGADDGVALAGAYLGRWLQDGLLAIDTGERE